MRRNPSYTKKGPGRRHVDGRYQRIASNYHYLWDKFFRLQYPSFGGWVRARFPGLDKLSNKDLANGRY